MRATVTYLPANRNCGCGHRWRSHTPTISREVSGWVCRFCDCKNFTEQIAAIVELRTMKEVT